MLGTMTLTGQGFLQHIIVEVQHPNYHILLNISSFEENKQGRNCSTGSKCIDSRNYLNLHLVTKLIKRRDMSGFPIQLSK